MKDFSSVNDCIPNKRIINYGQTRSLDTTQLSLLEIDPGHVRRKFYERAEDFGFQKELGSPNAIRRARAIELMQSNMPLPVVQRMLGHSTPGLTTLLVKFSDKDMHLVAKHFIDRESQRKTSARNTFFGKINDIQIREIPLFNF